VAAVEASIAAADAWIDSHAQHRHRVPFDPVPQTIRDLSAAEAVYRLKTRRRNMVSDRDHAEHEERLVWLRDLAKGLVSPGTDPRPRRSTSVVPAVLERPETEDISREALKGFA
jgi:phage gp36-like protein